MPDRRLVLRSLLAAATAPLLPAPIAAQTAPPARIRIAITSADNFAEGYYAQDAGFFTKAGLDVEVVGMTTGAQISAAVAGGAIDIGMSNTVQLVNAMTHGAPFVIVAAGGLYSNAAPNSALVVAKDSPLRTARDLEGKTCAVTALKDLTQIGPAAWMLHNGADPLKTRFVEIPFVEVPAALERGTVDAGMLAEPWLTAANGATVRVFARVFSDIAPFFVLSPWFTTLDYYRANTDLVRRFSRVVYDTARWANAHRPETAAILAKYAKIDLAVIQRMTRSAFATSLDPGQFQPVLTAMYKFGAIDKPMFADTILAKN
jgi:NitT/TauT family transport system substrate-binding protein